MMRIELDQERCQGHTICNAMAPEIFALRDDDGHAILRIAGTIPPRLEESAVRAVAGCPEQAITIVDDTE